MNNVLVFENKELQVIRDEYGEWLSTEEINKALGYKEVRYTRDLYYKHKDEFVNRDVASASHPCTKLISIQTNGGMQQSRVFNLRATLLLALYSETETGKKFREFILDILTGEKQLLSPAFIFLRDYFYNNEPKIKAYLQYNKMGLSDMEILKLLKINKIELETFQEKAHIIGEQILENTPVFDVWNNSKYQEALIPKGSNLNMEKLEYVGSYRDYAEVNNISRSVAKAMFLAWNEENLLIRVSRKIYKIKD